MTTKAGSAVYSSIQKSVHWLVVLLVIIQIWSSEGIENSHKAAMDGLTPDPFDLLLHNIHTLMGIVVFLLAITRIVLVIRRGAAPRDPSEPVWQFVLAKAVHGLIYLMLLALPVTGGLARNVSIDTFGLPHVILTKVLFFLIFLHVAGALFHYFIRKDGVLQRMLP